MSARVRFAVLCTLLVAALAVCTWMTVQRIEQNLLEEAQVALASASIPFYGVEVDGRDLVLTGFVADADEARRIRSVVDSVEGVRTIRDETVLERVAGGPTREPTTMPARLPARLRMQRLGGSVFISGRLPDDGTTEALARAAESRFGSSSLTLSATPSANVATPAWLTAPAQLVELLGVAADNVRLVIEGDAGVVSGQVSGARAAARLRELAGSIPGVAWRFELFSPRGPVAGGGGG